MFVKERTLTDLLSSERKTYVVPAFQRRYAWKASNFVQLWEDVAEVIDGNRKRHFMGTVVFESAGSNRSVVDGQQRLLTLTIILKVMHDLSIDYAPTCTRSIAKFLSLSGHPRLRPSLHDRAAFDVMLDNPTLLNKSHHSAVKACYEYFHRTISSYILTVSGQKPTHFEKIYRALVEKLIFVEIVLGDEDDTHAIFETINYAGVPLTAADLARNFVLSQAKSDSEQLRLHTAYWQPLEQALSSALSGTKAARKVELTKILPEFLRAVLVVEKRKYIGASDLFRELRAYFRKGPLEIKLKTLLIYADDYCKFLQPSLERRVNLQTRLFALLDLRMTTFNPVLLVLFRSNANGGTSTQDLIKAIQYIESFVVRRAFNSKVSRDLPKVFARIAGSLTSASIEKSLANALAQLLAKEKWPSDADFRPCFLSSPIYATAPATARFALLSLERTHQAAKERVLDRTIQIEHVFPQGAKSVDWDPKEVPGLKKRLHVIGNLTLTAYNGKLSNNAFADKLRGADGYKKSPYWLTKTLANCDNWTKVEIDKRAGHLLKQALKIWPGPP
jgi:uncharacterized protein with ParB-like and HNH nuclease domain